MQYLLFILKIQYCLRLRLKRKSKNEENGDRKVRRRQNGCGKHVEIFLTESDFREKEA